MEDNIKVNGKMENNMEKAFILIEIKLKKKECGNMVNE